MNPAERRAVSVVTDSTADLPPGLVQRLGITVVPLNVHFGKDVFRDGVDLRGSEFYDRLRQHSSLPTTSQPAVALFEEVYGRLLEERPEIVSIHIAARLSGTYDAAALAAAAIGDDRVAVLDSQMVSLGLGWAVVVAARAAAAGLGRAEVVAAAEDAFRRVEVVAVLDSLEYLQRGGRIGPTRALLGAALSIKPIIRVRGGEVHPLGRVRTRAKALQRLEELVRERGPYEELAVLHSDQRELAESFRLRLASIHDPSRILVSELGPVVGTHGGPGIVGVGGLRSA